jgi:TIR domain
MNPEIFISHCSADRQLADALCELFKKAFALSPFNIRCTSVDAYKLTPGAQFERILKAELGEASVFVAVITQNSLQSFYVLFEIGARWGSDRTIFPILGEELTAQLKQPLSDMYLLKSSSREDVSRLLTKVQEVTKLHLQPGRNYKASIDSVVKTRVQSLRERDMRILHDNTMIHVAEVDRGYVEFKVTREFTMASPSGGSFPYEVRLDKGYWGRGCLLQRRMARGRRWQDLKLQCPDTGRNTICLAAPVQLTEGDYIKGHLESTERFPKARGFYQLAYCKPKEQSTFRWSQDWKRNSLDVFYYSEDLTLRTVPEGVPVMVDESSYGINYVLRWNPEDELSRRNA